MLISGDNFCGKNCALDQTIKKEQDELKSKNVIGNYRLNLYFISATCKEVVRN